MGDDVRLWLRVFPPAAHVECESLGEGKKKKNADALFVMLSGEKMSSNLNVIKFLSLSQISKCTLGGKRHHDDEDDDDDVILIHSSR